MIGFFRKNQQALIIFIILYALISVLTIHFLNSQQIYAPELIRLPFLANMRNALLNREHLSFLFPLLTIFGLLFLGFYLVRIVIGYIIIPKRTQFPALFFISVCSFAFYQGLYISVITSSVLFLVAVEKVFSSVNDKESSLRFLDAGILLALGCFFYLNTLFLLPFFWIAQLTLKQINYRELLFTIVGLLLPFLYLFSIYFVIEKSLSDVFQNIGEWMFLKKTVVFSKEYLIALGAYSAVIVLAIFFAWRKYATAKIHTRKLYQLFFYLFLNIVLLYILVPSAGVEIFFFLAIPCSVLLSIYFTDCKPHLVNRFIFILLLILPILANTIRLENNYDFFFLLDFTK